MSRCKSAAFVLVASIIAVAGCDSTTAKKNAESGSEGSKYLLKSEPRDAKTPTDVKESVSEPTVLAIAGRIDAGDMEPFQDGVASFMISQLPDSSHAESDPQHADNCPFCKRKLKNAPKAVVRILDGSGNVMSVDARQLLGVSKGDVVVVQGLATYLKPVNTVQIDAEGIFIR